MGPIDLDYIKKQLSLGYKVNPITQCWEWKYSRRGPGYGTLKHNGKRYQVHRLSALVHLGFDIESNFFICHTCDNPPCYNPEHLFVGDHRTNALDMHSKKRHPNSATETCPNGHSYNDAYIGSTNGRVCRTCSLIKNKIYKLELKIARLKEMISKN